MNHTPNNALPFVSFSVCSEYLDKNEIWNPRADEPPLEAAFQINVFGTRDYYLKLAEFIRELKQFETDGGFPNFVLLFLPNDHTGGTRGRAPAPGAQVADNDLAFGHVVEAVSHSKFWRETCLTRRRGCKLASPCDPLKPPERGGARE